MQSYLVSRSTPATPISVSSVPWDDERVNWADFSAIVIRSTWDYHKREKEFAAWLDRLETVKGSVVVFNDPAIMKWNMRKTYLKKMLDKGLPDGVVFAKTLWFDTDSIRGDVENLCLGDCLRRHGMADKVIVKPVVGAGESRFPCYTLIVGDESMFPHESVRSKPLS